MPKTKAIDNYLNSNISRPRTITISP